MGFSGCTVLDYLERQNADVIQRSREYAGSDYPSPPRHRSPARRSSRREYAGRSRSRSPDGYRVKRDDRRSRSPRGNGAYGGAGYGSSRMAAPQSRSYEERAQAKEQMMESVRSTSQQDRRVYIGNLAYDVKWHQLKDYMRQGMCSRLEL